jgi:hypothetical protein
MDFNSIDIVDYCTGGKSVEGKRMSNLKDLVPPQELCKQIPEGEFADSCFVRFGNKPYIIIERRLIRKDAGRKDNVFPAPTLQELLIALPDWSELSVDFVNPQITLKLKKGMIKAAPAEVLKLWLKLKGIEDGK